MIASLQHRCGLGLATALLLALACQPPVPAVRCSDDSDCPADYLCDEVRQLCRVDPLARDDWQRDGATRDEGHDAAFDAALDAARDAARDAGRDGATSADRSGLDGALPDGAVRERHGLELSAIEDAIELSETFAADLRKPDRAGDVDSGATEAGPTADAGPIPDAGQGDACDCFIDGSCHGAGSYHPATPCLWCDPAAPTLWSDNDGYICAGDPCTNAQVCEGGQCIAFFRLFCNFSCDVAYQRCCGAVDEPCCTSYTQCTAGTRCLGLTPSATCASTNCGGPEQVCCGDLCEPGLVCELGPQLCHPCGANQQYCCDGVNCGSNNVCDQSGYCTPCGHIDQLCCPDSTCFADAPACCVTAYPASCTASCG